MVSKNVEQRNIKVSIQIEGLDVLEEERKHVVEIVQKYLQEKVKEEVKGGKLEIGVKYWHISTGGNVERESWCDYTIDEDRWKMGNCYYSKEEAEKARDKQILITELKRCANFKPDWKDLTVKYSLYYNNGEEQWEVDDNFNSQEIGQIYFKTEKELEDIIEEYGKRLDLLL